MSSEGPAFVGGQERLGIYSVEKGHFEVSRVVEGEACLEVLASSRFLMTKTREAKEQYQIVRTSESSISEEQPASMCPSRAFAARMHQLFSLVFSRVVDMGKCMQLKLGYICCVVLC